MLFDSGRKRPLSPSQTEPGVVLRRRGEETGLEAFLRARSKNTQPQEGSWRNSQHVTNSHTSGNEVYKRTLFTEVAYQGRTEKHIADKENFHNHNGTNKSGNSDSSLTFEQTMHDVHASVHHQKNSGSEDYAFTCAARQSSNLGHQTPLNCMLRKGFENETRNIMDHNMSRSEVLTSEGVPEKPKRRTSKHSMIPSLVHANVFSSSHRVPLSEVDLNRTSTHQMQGCSSNASHSTIEDPVCIQRRRGPSVATTIKNRQSHNVHEQTDGNPVKNLNKEFEDAADSTFSDGEDFEQDEEDDHTPNLNMWNQYMDLGPPNVTCSKCGSLMWNVERNNKSSKGSQPTFSLCCRNGQVVLPKEKKAPEPLQSLFTSDRRSKNFKKNIRVYNAMFAMSSSGGRVDHKINRGGAPYCFKIRGMNLHFMGSLLPLEGEAPKFCQLYIYDTENELNNRLNAFGDNVSEDIDESIVEELQGMLHTHNNLVRQFHTARERFKSGEQDEFRLVLVSSQAANGRPNNVGPSNEVGGLVVNQNEDTSGFRDTVVETRHKELKRVWETDVYFMQLQYPLLFPLGEDGFHTKIKLVKNKQTQRPVSENSGEFGDIDGGKSSVTTYQ
ncbi:uncharacterized protein LOC108207426 [Daucus carota subsp. sativus]|uniref:uncharacterized protein LOC108207426 n=1 Tax=Daucus carota subsp. sativus TaxID=79200 RepID=UPI003082DEA3